MSLTNHLVLCACHNTEHIMVVSYDPDERCPEVYVSMHLRKAPFWSRLIYAIKYIFGYQSKYGAFDEIVLKPKDADKFIKVGKYLKKANGKQEVCKDARGEYLDVGDVVEFIGGDGYVAKAGALAEVVEVSGKAFFEIKWLSETKHLSGAQMDGGYFTSLFVKHKVDYISSF